MKLWIILQTGIDILIFFIIIGYILKGNFKKDKGNAQSDITQDLNTVTKSLKEILNESDRLAERIAEEKKIGEDLTRTLNAKIQEFEKLIMKGEQVARQYQQTQNTSSSFPGSEERYKMVAKLSREGLDREEIARITGVQKGEIDLIRNLNET